MATTHTYAQGQQPKLVSWQEVADLPVPPADHVLAYGPDSLQFGELRLPQGKGPFPVVVVVHGGCWLAAYDRQYMAHLSQALTQAGYATWNLEFRRVGDSGGGWPGTFLDVAQGTDHLRTLAKKYPMDVKETVVIGHSAGGHLALWLAARHNLPKGSPLYIKKPLKLKGVVALAGIPDLETYSQQEGSCNKAVPELMGGMPAEQAARYAEASPSRLLPLKVPVRLVQGSLDPIVPVTQSSQFEAQARAAGDDATLILLPNAGHFDLVAPQSPVQQQVLQTVHELFRLK
ncbi:alpha/beta fold hydrolase [Pontibacter sp. E15-1]|uniref:alpha/beta hydrolase family protein n=1 Tax=Pontibacter sp. E15-1 TaxID=2919918 RepID=UPI001F4F9D52|nr:alpha/beta fold hydrolase [Pontibacter sp. E15-1]MCJ8164270.1 alpha/beta fold hydrolase [Pontibacter sp. E15-1]